MKSDFAQSIQVLKNCRVCGTDYGTNKIRIIEKNDDGSVAHITCPKCVHSSLVFFGQTEHGFGFLGFTTDLSAKDVVRLSKKSKITMTTVRGTQKLLREASGSLVSYIYYQSLLS
jgi:hypothetical protein